ncbi:MAG: PASTA domain-containing protein [Ruminiclostridium sp.]|nr:PASTA domain-containing protein [Ruminiclostridium sp.]
MFGKLTVGMKKRIGAIAAVLIAGMSLYVTIFLFYWSVIQHDSMLTEAENQQQREITILADRGNIYDRNGKVLAQNTPAWDIVLSPREIRRINFDEEGEDKERDEENYRTERDFICRNIAEILGLDPQSLIDACDRHMDEWVYVAKKQVDRDTVAKVEKFMSDNRLSGVMCYARENSIRYYPNGSLAANVLGFVNSEGGAYGIESYYDKYLTGVNGKLITTKDQQGDDMPYGYEMLYEAKQGNSLVLTIDETLQYYLEKNLETTVSQHKIENRSTGIIMNAKTGAVVAMATYPGFNPNDPSYIFFEKDRYTLSQMSDDKVAQEEIDNARSEIWGRQWQNKAVGELYIPGSVFKIFTCAAALEEEKVDLGSTFLCTGVAEVAGTHIKCWSSAGHGTSNLTEAMIHSCNPAFIKIGQLLGQEKFTKYFEAFGFTEKTGIDLPGEADSLYVPLSDMGIVELSSSAFGQTNKVTPIQMATAVCAAVNGGKLMTPYIVDKIIDGNGNVVEATEPEVRRQVISEETSATMRRILEDVVNYNGGSNAYISGYRIGGKSGTSEKIDDFNSGKHDELRYVATFCAVVPANDPEYVMLVVADEPTSGYIYGSAIAAPVVSAVFKEGLEYLNIFPQYTEEDLAMQDVSVPYVTGYNSIRAEALLTAAGLQAEIVGSTDEGAMVGGQYPQSGAVMPKGGKVVLYMGEMTIADYQLREVPDVRGMTVTEANKVITEAGFNIKLQGAYGSNEARAIYQDTTPGTLQYRGGVIKVDFLVNDETG